MRLGGGLARHGALLCWREPQPVPSTVGSPSSLVGSSAITSPDSARPSQGARSAANMTALGLGLACSATSVSSRCQQYQQPPAATTQRWPGLYAPRPSQPAFGTGTRQLAAWRPALRRPPPPVAADSIATTGEGPGSSGSSGSSGSDSSAGGGGLAALLRSAYDWLCSIKPPKTVWRTVAALVLGGEAMVRILQGERGKVAGLRCCRERSQHLACIACKLICVVIPL